MDVAIFFVWRDPIGKDMQTLPHQLFRSKYTQTVIDKK